MPADEAERRSAGGTSEVPGGFVALWGTQTMTYFPEPTTPDESWPGWDETAVEWFTRSTQPRARAVREFLNRSLRCFPEGHAKSLAKRLNQD